MPNGYEQEKSQQRINEKKAYQKQIKVLEAENNRLMLWIDHYGLNEKVQKGGKP